MFLQVEDVCEEISGPKDAPKTLIRTSFSSDSRVFEQNISAVPLFLCVLKQKGFIAFQWWKDDTSFQSFSMMNLKCFVYLYVRTSLM